MSAVKKEEDFGGEEGEESQDQRILAAKEAMEKAEQELKEFKSWSRQRTTELSRSLAEKRKKYRDLLPNKRVFVRSSQFQVFAGGEDEMNALLAKFAPKPGESAAAGDSSLGEANASSGSKICLLGRESADQSTSNCNSGSKGGQEKRKGKFSLLNSKKIGKLPQGCREEVLNRSSSESDSDID